MALGLAAGAIPAARAFAGPADCDPAQAASRFPIYAHKVVAIGTNASYPPFSFSDPADFSRMTGLDVAIVTRALDCAGLKYQFVKGATAGLYPALFSGALDVMIGNIFIRPDRLERASFVLYMVNGQSLVVPAGNPGGITTPGGMCGHVATGLYVGTSATVVQDLSRVCVEAGHEPIHYVAAEDQESAYRALANGRTDMVMDGAASAGLRVRAPTSGFTIAFTLSTGMKSGVIVPKGNTEMLRAIADGMKQLQSSGVLQALMLEYGLQPDWLIPVEVHP
jgi:ABC-type amino acid transport substrate-binding protein